MGGNKGLQYNKKSFTIMPGTLGGKQSEEFDVRPSVMTDKERIKLRAQDNRVNKIIELTPKKKAKKIIPYGDKILVQRQRIGKTMGSGIIHTTTETEERPTEIAEVVYIPDHSFTDKSLLEHAEQIINALTAKCTGGDSEALISLLRFHEYLQIKSIKVGDKLMISRYAGTDFMVQETGECLSLINADGIIALIVENE